MADDRFLQIAKKVKEKGVNNLTAEDLEEKESNPLFETPDTETAETSFFNQAQVLDENTEPNEFAQMVSQGEADTGIPVSPATAQAINDVRNPPVEQVNTQKTPAIQPDAQIPPVEQAIEEGIVEATPVQKSAEDKRIETKKNQVSEYEAALDAQLANAQDKELDMTNQIEDQKKVISEKLDDAKKAIKGANILQSGTIGQKILAGIAIFLGGTGDGPNTALKILQRQEDQIIKQNQPLLNKYENQLGDLDKAKLALRSDIYEVLKNKYAKLAETASPAYKIKIQQAISNIDKNELAMKIQLNEIAEKELASKQTGPLTIEQIQAIPDLKERTAKLNRVVRDENGQFIGLADTKDKASKLSEQIDTIAPSINGINKLEKFAKTGNILDPNKRAEVDTIIGTIVGALRLPITGPGILTDSERKMLKDLIGNPNNLFSLKSSNLKRLNTIKEFLQSTVEVKKRTAGVAQIGTSKTFREKK